MNKKLVLTSTISLVLACPAVATPSHTSNTFPVDGYMQPDYTYVGQATYENIGAYGGDVVAEAEYQLIDYTINAGQYLPQSSTTVSQCTAGSFCPGSSTTVNYNTTMDQGITSCSTVGDHSYTLSDLGSSAATDCYRNCASGDVANLKSGGTMTGRVFSNNVNTCGPSDVNQCANGYHYTAGTTAPDLAAAIGVISAGEDYEDYYGFISNNGESTYNEDKYGLTENGTFVVDYGNGKKIRGKSQCSTRGVANLWYNNNYTFSPDHFTSELPNSTGEYCYCQLDGYTLTNEEFQNLSGLWVLNIVIREEDGLMCASDCAFYCADFLRDSNTAGNAQFHEAMFNSVQSTPASCDANTITINWTDAAEGAVAANNAGTATYGGDIRTPSAAVDKTNIGLRFKGWKFSKPQN